MVRARSAYLHYRDHGRSLVVLRVCSFDFFRLGLTEVHSASHGLEQLGIIRGRQFSSLGQAAQTVHAALNGPDAGSTDYLREYEAYCVGRFDRGWEEHVGQGRRRMMLQGSEVESPYSPALLVHYVELAPDSYAPDGKWVSCCDLLPFVPVSMPEHEARARLASTLAEYERNPPQPRSNMPPPRREPPGGSSEQRGEARRRPRSPSPPRRARREEPRDGRGRDERASFPAPPPHENPPRHRHKEGLCVYRKDADASVPHEILSCRLADRPVRGSESLKMLTLRPLLPPGAPPLEVPYLYTVPLQANFRAAWEAARCDRRTVANAAVYDAHIEAVRMTAKVAVLSESKIFHDARWGSGQAATNPPPPELEMDALGRCAYPGASEVPHEVVGHRLTPSGEGRLLTLRPLGAAAGSDTVDCAAASLVALDRRFEAVWCLHGCDEGETAANRHVYTAHVEAVQRHAAAVGGGFRLSRIWHQLRHGLGVLPGGVPVPSELAE